VPSCIGVMAPCIKGTSRPSIGKTACYSWLWHNSASCWLETRRIGLAIAAAAASAALVALKRTRALHDLARALYKTRRLILLLLLLLFLLLLYTRVKSYKDLRKSYKRREVKGERTYKRRL
jgi:cytochrome bd-type quinol oxidase subunit 2